MIAIRWSVNNDVLNEINILLLLIREAAILVIGVISGFKHEFKAIEPQLRTLVPFLLEELSSPGGNSQIKATICWTLST